MTVKKSMIKKLKDVLYNVYLGVLSGMLTDDSLKRLLGACSSIDEQSAIYAAICHAKLSGIKSYSLDLDQFLHTMYLTFALEV